MQTHKMNYVESKRIVMLSTAFRTHIKINDRQTLIIEKNNNNNPTQHHFNLEHL